MEDQELLDLLTRLETLEQSFSLLPPASLSYSISIEQRITALELSTSQTTSLNPTPKDNASMKALAAELSRLKASHTTTLSSANTGVTDAKLLVEEQSTFNSWFDELAKIKDFVTSTSTSTSPHIDVTNAPVYEQSTTAPDVKRLEAVTAKIANVSDRANLAQNKLDRMLEDYSQVIAAYNNDNENENENYHKEI
ncbi:hypothetical protein ScalyP_jg11097 [Parmales sp. scaly parma]|nr:hypothetical protein ScalyP_jg11097 [Parmales sp. scaly parma]